MAMKIGDAKSVLRGFRAMRAFRSLRNGFGEFVVSGGESWEAARSFKLSGDLQYR